MSSILYYITGHGYGHAVRSIQVIGSLKKTSPDLQIHVRTTAPEWLFLDRAFQSRQAIDVGILQKDSLEMDLDKTLRACQSLHDGAARLIEQEADCEIYRVYTKNYPAFISLIEEMETFYRNATLALTLPYPCGMEIFPRQEPIPWVARTSLLTKQEARRAFRLPQSATLVLLSFGGLGLERLPWNNLKQLGDFFFVTTGETKQETNNLRVLPEAQRNYEDLVRAVDVVVTKPGYGIVADVISHQVRTLYTERGEFAEYPHLTRALDECATAEFIPQDQLLSGNLAPHLTRLLDKKESWPAVPLDGAAVAAAKILGLIDH